MADLTVVKSEPLQDLSVVKSEPLPSQQKPTGQTLWETLGGQTLQDLIGGASRDPKRAQKAIDTLKGLVTGIADEPHRVLGQLAASGEAMTRGDVAGAASHLGGAVPFIGAGAREVQHDVEQGNYRTAAERTLGLALPFATHQIGAAVSGAPEAAATAARAVSGGARGAFDAATETVPLKRYGIDINVPTPIASGAAGAATARMAGLPGSYGAVVGASAPIIKGAVKGARARMAQGALEEAAAATPAAALTPGQALASASNIPWDGLAPEERALFESSAAEQARQKAAAAAPRPAMGPPAAPSPVPATGEAATAAPGRTVAQMIQDEFNARQGETEPASPAQASQGPPEMLGAHPVKNPLGPGPVGNGPLRPPLAQMTKPQIIEAAGLPKDAPAAQVEAAVSADQAERASAPLADPSKPIEPTVEVSPDKKTVTLYSWSNEPRETLDPGKFGTGKPGAELTRRTRGGWGDQFPNRLSYWDTPEANERGFGPGSERPVRHTVEVPSDKVYDLGTDPDGFRQKAGGDVTQAEIDLKKAGFSGYSYNLGGKNVYAIFDEQKPHAIEKFGTDYANPEVVKAAQGNTATVDAMVNSEKPWAVVTGTQGSVGAFDHPENLAANKALKAELESRGYKPVSMQGSYKGVSDGETFYVPGMTAEEAQAIGQKYGQEAVLVGGKGNPSGMLNTSGKLDPMDLSKIHYGADALRQDYHSTVMDPATGKPVTFSIDMKPVDELQSSVAKPRTLAQTNAAMAQKQPAPVDLQEAKTATNVSGDRKSPEMRGAERTAQNVDAKAQRWADAFKSEGMTAEDVGNMQKQDFEVMRNGLIAKGKLPEGENIPNSSIDSIIKKMKEPAPGGGMGALKNNFNPEPGKVQGGSIAESLQKTADDATQRLRDRGAFSGGKLNANFPAEDFKDMATWGAAKLAKGTVDLASWSKEMLADAGTAADKLRPMLPDMFAKSQKILEKHIANTLEGGLPTTEKLLEMYRAGEEGKDWYKYTQGELENHFGTDAPMFVDFLAATSPNASVKANVALALKAYQQWKSGEDFSGYMPSVKGNLERATQGIPPSGPKVTSFKANLFGNTESVTVDRWMARAMNWKRDNLTPDQYKFIDYNLTQVAKEAGVEPRQIQAAIWKAIKDAQGRAGDTGASFEQAIKEKMAKSPEFKALIEKLKQGDSGLGGHA